MRSGTAIQALCLLQCPEAHRRKEMLLWHVGTLRVCSGARDMRQAFPGMFLILDFCILWCLMLALSDTHEVIPHVFFSSGSLPLFFSFPNRKMNDISGSR